MKKVLVSVLLLFVAMISFPQSLQQFQAKMNGCSWCASDGVRYPCFMTSSDTWVDDVSSSVTSYSYGSVELHFWPLIGGWASAVEDTYAVPGVYITPYAKISRVTYKQTSLGIYSGYLTDGRVFYMHVNVMWGYSIVDVESLVAVYPKSYEAACRPIINEVLKWRR